MAEFIFDLQRFDDSGSKGGEGGGKGGAGGGGTGNGGAGWDPVTDEDKILFDARRSGHIVFPLFMDTATADLFSETAWDNFTTANRAGIVPTYDFSGNAFVDTIPVSRFESTVLINDYFDVINLTDANVGNIIEYYTFRNGGHIALVFDSGDVLDFDIDMISPVVNFQNGEKMMYSAVDRKWLTGEELEAAQVFWTTAAQDYGTDDVSDTFVVTQAANTALFNVDGTNVAPTGLIDVSDVDHIYLDAASYDVEYTNEVDDDSISLVFPSGGALFVQNSSDYSPIFHFADGSVQYYNRIRDEWRDSAYIAADYAEDQVNLTALASAEKLAYETGAYALGYDYIYEADETDVNGNYLYRPSNVNGGATFQVSALTNTLVYDAAYNDNITFTDALWANVVSTTESYDATDDKYYLDIVFNTGTTTRIGYTYNFSPTITFADGYTMGYDLRTDTWGTAYYATPNVAEELDLSIGADSLVYEASQDDLIYFADSTFENIQTSAANDFYVNLMFNTGTTTSVRYTDDYSPDFVFASNPAIHYHYNYQDGWSAPSTAYYADTNAAENINLSRAANTFVYDASANDKVYFLDAVFGNLLYVDADSVDVKLTFDTGATTEIRYNTMATPDIVFGDGSTYYYQLTATADGGFTGTWMTYGIDGNPMVVSPLAESADLWGDVAPADDLLTDGTVAADATLSDLVAPAADVTSFDAGNAFDLQSASEFVLATPSTDPSQKSA